MSQLGNLGLCPRTLGSSCLPLPHGLVIRVPVALSTQITYTVCPVSKKLY